MSNCSWCNSGPQRGQDMSVKSEKTCRAMKSVGHGPTFLTHVESPFARQSSQRRKVKRDERWTCAVVQGKRRGCGGEAGGGW